jgi:hypothetical protein
MSARVLRITVAVLLPLGGAALFWFSVRRGSKEAPPVALTAAAAPSEGPDRTDRCRDFVAFCFSCGIGRPPEDPTVDIGIQRNNELVVMDAVIQQCRAQRMPFDVGLIECFDRASTSDAADRCASYVDCADDVVRRRDR